MFPTFNFNLLCLLHPSLLHLSTFDPFAIARTNTFMPYEFIHGLAAGNVFKQASAAVQIMNVKPGEYKGKATYELTLREIRGNDSIITTQ